MPPEEVFLFLVGDVARKTVLVAKSKDGEECTDDGLVVQSTYAIKIELKTVGGCPSSTGKRLRSYARPRALTFVYRKRTRSIIAAYVQFEGLGHLALINADHPHRTASEMWERLSGTGKSGRYFRTARIVCPYCQVEPAGNRDRVRTSPPRLQAWGAVPMGRRNSPDKFVGAT